MENQQCPARLQTLPPTFPNWFFADMLRCRLRAWVGNVILLSGQLKTTMSSQVPDPVPNFSKMALCISLRVQVGNLIRKCAPPARVMGNQQCPARLQAIPSTFPNCSFADMLGCRLGAWVGNVILLPRQSKTTMSSQGPDTAPTFSKMVLCISVRVQVGNLIEKCAPPARVMKNQQCPARLQAMPPTFPNWSRLENVGSSCKPFKTHFDVFCFESS